MSFQMTQEAVHTSGAPYTTWRLSAYHRLHIVDECTYDPEWDLRSGKCLWSMVIKMKEEGRDGRRHWHRCFSTDVPIRYANYELDERSFMLSWILQSNGKRCSCEEEVREELGMKTLHMPNRCIHTQLVYMTGDSLSTFSFDIQQQLIYLSILFLITTFCSLGREVMLQKRLECS